MNTILNPYSKFALVYIDDVLIFSESIEQHLKHLRIFKNLIKKNGMVVSQKKIKLAQIKIRFLGHDIYQGTITPIKRSIEFSEKFPDKIKYKTQLQRFLGCVNYVADFIPKIRILCI
uniref:Polyprotein n=1 Tax=Cajanus cajan TaxID=3821 RepID=A0A151TB95_CAJCA|nr:polyprotein [Cajanus cajan]